MHVEICQSYMRECIEIIYPLMLTLKHFEEQAAQASGFLGKMHNAKFIGVVTIMNHVLPIFNRLSCTFQ